MNSRFLEHDSDAMNLRLIFLVLLFVGFCYPVLVDGISINYSFVLFPVLMILLTHRIQRVSLELFWPVVTFAGIFMIALVLPSDYHQDNHLRQCVSFGIFLTAFSFMFVKITANMIRAFKIAILFTSIGFSSVSIWGFFALGGQSLHFEAKDLVGQQMLGFVYILAIWMTLYYQANQWLTKIGKLVALAILLAGLMLTFSRSAIVALLGSGALFAMAYLLRWLRNPALAIRRRMLGVLVVLVVVTIGIYKMFPVTFDFFEETLFGRNLVQEAASPDDSAGIRMLLWRRIVEYVLQHPLTGSGYLGVWIMPGLPADVGSAHNQYMDVFYRTGILGAIAYAWLLYCVLRYFRRHDRAMFWGMTGVLIFGMFHETFKESEGAFILAFSLGMLAESRRQHRREIASRLGNVRIEKTYTFSTLTP